MSGFDLGELLPFYLDETDEQIAALNDALLKLEQNPDDAPVLREAFRMIHSIKGSSTVMGFDQVKQLTHHLETYFDQLRSGERTLDRPILDLSFRCLDGLRDFHRELRSGGSSSVELSGLTAEVIASLHGEPPPAGVESRSEVEPEPEASDLPEPPAPVEPEPEPPPEAQPEPALVAETVIEEVPAPAPPAVEADSGVVQVVHVVLAPHLPWPDMKAKLVLNRLGSKGRVIRTEPPIEQIETAETLPSFRVWVASDAAPQTLAAQADVEGVDTVTVSAANAGGSSEAEADVAPVTDAPVASTPSPAVPAGPVASASAPVAPLRPAAAPAAQAKPAAPTVPAAAPTPPKKVAETLRVDVDRLDSLMNLAGELVINRARFYEIAQGLEELFRDSNARLLTADTEDRLGSLSHELEVFAAHASGRSDAGAAADRWAVQLRRLRDNFAEIRRELDLIRLGRERVNALGEAIHQLARVTDGLQKGVLDTRMVPIGPLFERFHRVIRDLRMSSGKEVSLRIEGEKTELDKRMIDELGDPLIHMVRNSVDHGLERPDDRVKAGKPRAGTVSLVASHRGNSVVITVSDDGRGINAERVRRKVVENGLLSDEESRKLTDRQAIQYIWHPGLSTAEKITDISGRGVGMDIVKSRIESLNGTVDVRSEPGIGTTFTIRLPLTLAILPCLLVRVHEEVYAIPLDHIDEIVEATESRMYAVRGKRMIEIRGKLVSVVALDDVLTWQGGPPRSRTEPVNGKVTIVVAQNGDTTVGLLVDQLIGMQEVVLKSLEKNFRPVPSLSGASILGDGRVSLILDVDAVINMIANTQEPAPTVA
ncbi:MAG: chemotaxis protein CheA [Isosphaeraceae bacterium]